MMHQRERERDAVQRLLRDEGLKLVSNALGVTAATLSGSGTPATRPGLPSGTASSRPT